MYLTIHSKEGQHCKFHVDSADNDWQRWSWYLYQGVDLRDCKEYQITRGVSSIYVEHSGSGGVKIDYWRVFTESGSYYCEDGKDYDNGASHSITCVRGNDFYKI